MKTILFLVLSSPFLFSKTFVYECQDNKHFVIQIDKDKAWLFTKETSMALPKVVSASGEKYEKEGITFWSHGYEARLDTPQTQYRKCSNNRDKAVWEDAKLRGKDFRAIGNEPGWYLEIGEGAQKTLLVTDYGAERYELRLPKPFNSQVSRTTRYRIQGFLDILIEGKRCRDSMSNHSYEASVHIKINGKVYKGCGKSLH